LRQWCLIGGALMIITLVGGWLTLAKLWQTSPEGLNPVVKVSVLDLLQTRSLAATARKAAAAGDLERSLQAWKGALGNNLADDGLWRELLDQLNGDLTFTNNNAVEPYLESLGWFCRLTRTNAQDVLRAARVCARHEHFEQLLTLPWPDSSRETEALEVLRLKALFHVGRMYEFIPLYEQNREELDKNTDFDLYRQAYLAGWGDPADQAAWWEKLESGAKASGQERLGRKLGLIVANQTGDSGKAVRLVRELETAKEDSITDHALLWLTLVGDNRKPEALADMAGRQLLARTATDLNLIATACRRLGLTNQCARLLNTAAPRLGRRQTPESANVWIIWAALASEARDWAALRTIAGVIRKLPGPCDWLDGYADFLEGYGAQQMAEGPLAENRLARAAKADFPVGNLGVATARGLSELGHLDWAENILRPLEDRFDHSPAYWRTVWSVAIRQHQDEDWLMKSASRLHELEPDVRITRFNYAAALLVRRESPAEALRIMFDIRQTTRRELYTELNYAIALVRTGRLEEARDILANINAPMLTDAERPSYHLCRVEMFLGTGDTNRAAAELKAIDPSNFFPCQVRWLEETAAKLNLSG
jgi:hypothetical protein